MPVVAGTVDRVTVRNLPWQRMEFVRHEEVRFTEGTGGIGIDGLGFKASTARRSQSQKILLTKIGFDTAENEPSKILHKIADVAKCCYFCYFC